MEKVFKINQYEQSWQITKKNGIYSHKNFSYIVFDNQLAGYCDYFGNIYELAQGFNVSKGKATDRLEARDILKGYLKQFTKLNKNYD